MTNQLADAADALLAVALPDQLTKAERETVEALRRTCLKGGRIQELIGMLDRVTPGHTITPPLQPAIKPGTLVKSIALGYPIYGYYKESCEYGHKIAMFQDGSGQTATTPHVEPLRADGATE